MPTTRRLDGLDAARGLACVSMLVAHLCPTGGPFLVSEYLTAPLFAVIIGVSMGVVLTERRPPTARFVRDNLQRGLFLILLGVLLQQVYAQIVVVLPYLGLLIIVMAPLAVLLHRRPVLTMAVAAAGAAAGPLVLERARLALDQHIAAWPSWWEDLVRWVGAGESYRLVSFLPMALGGLGLATVLRRATRPREGCAAVGALLAASAVAYLLGRSTSHGSAAYSGSTAEVVGATLLAAGAVIASFLLLDLATRLGAGRLVDPVLSTGRLALTAYTLQILFLAIAALARGPVPDDSWLVLTSTTCVVVGGCWLFERRLGTGPLEWVVHRTRPTTRPVVTERVPSTTD
jgi:uncharacterized membrane protein YeiB